MQISLILLTPLYSRYPFTNLPQGSLTNVLKQPFLSTEKDKSKYSKQQKESLSRSPVKQPMKLVYWGGKGCTTTDQ